MQGDAAITGLRLVFDDGSPDATWTDKNQLQLHTYAARAIAVGQIVPNFSDGYLGAAPDVGAQESGSTTPMKFGISAGP